jgi:hypothetical protein
MFLKSSRYAALPTVGVPSPRGDGEVTVVKLRLLPAPPAEPTAVRGPDRLDAMSEARYRDATRYWHIADANTELEAAQLVREPGRVIQVPED